MVNAQVLAYVNTPGGIRVPGSVPSGLTVGEVAILFPGALVVMPDSGNQPAIHTGRFLWQEVNRRVEIEPVNVDAPPYVADWLVQLTLYGDGTSPQTATLPKVQAWLYAIANEYMPKTTFSIQG